MPLLNRAIKEQGKKTKIENKLKFNLKEYFVTNSSLIPGLFQKLIYWVKKENLKSTIKNYLIFNEWALRPIHSISRDVRLFVCVFVRHTLETTLPEGLETSGRMAYR